MCYAMSIAKLQTTLREFAAEREWEQFHTPKNLVMALAGEVGELTELFQWLSPEASFRVASDGPHSTDVRDELADVFGYLLRLADVLDVDLEAALDQKITKNAEKYPVETSRGSSAKYSYRTEKRDTR